MTSLNGNQECLCTESQPVNGYLEEPPLIDYGCVYALVPEL